MPQNKDEKLSDRSRGTQDAARFEAAFAHVAVGVSLADLQGNFTEVNSAFCEITGYTETELLATDFSAITHPDDLPMKLALVERLRAGDIPRFEIEKRYVRKGGAVVWVRNSMSLVRDTAGRATGTIALTVDITEQVERRRREQFLADLAERARRLTDPEDVIADAVRSAGEFLGVSRCLFADIDLEADTCTVPPEYRADASVASIAGVFPISAFGPYVVAEYQAGRVAVVDDVRADPAKAPPDTIAAYEAIGVRAYVAAPVLHSARLVSALVVHSAAPRRWQPEETALLQAVVERTWLTVEVIRQQRALVREAETTARILESITDAFFALDAQWRFTHINDQAERVLLRTRAELLGRSIWEMFPDAQGSTFECEYRRAVAKGITVSFEEFFPPLDAWFEVRAYPSLDGLSVFFQNVNARKQSEEELRRSREDLRIAIDAARLGTFFCDWPFDKITWNETCKRHFFLPADAEVDFALFYALLHPDDRAPTRAAIDRAMTDHVEYNVEYRTLAPDGRTRWVNAVGRGYYDDAGLPVRFDGITIDISERKALEVERAQIAEREHRIAEQLQAALQPELPGVVPGLALAKYYEAALTDQAGVGGDFYDVFSIEKGCTALVLGDLSGKGLQAAAAVATVRNMLRAFLYTKPTVADAVTELNRVLAENNLLKGFTTLFVSAYDSVTKTLNFVNCGQEPALIRRAVTGAVEQLPPTGPILGTLENVQYMEERVLLVPGDALAIFSDGITECGPSRTDMLGIEGVTALFAQSLPPGAREAAEIADLLTTRLIDGVDAAAQGGVMRDDVCLLVAVVT